MPIRLGDPTTSASGPWNHYVLIILWILQFGTVAYFEVDLGILVLVLAAFGGGAGFLFALPIFLANLAVLYSIVHEWRQFNADTLTSVLYYRYQAAKSAWFLCILAVLLVPALKSVGFFATVWKFGMFVAPFWGAFWYSYVVRRNDSGFDGEGIRALW